ncbi:MAG TPA: hypothetical protein VHF25_00980 [Nitriliruptorales bacterium]|nr:hypothetical protein [Nitriliruptorales bacterium]
MATIEITPAGNDLYQVEIRDDQGSSTHEVTVPDGYADKVGAGHVSHQDLVRESVRFLLEREPRQQILSQFALSDIQSYFPEYEDQIAGRLGGSTG